MSNRDKKATKAERAVRVPNSSQPITIFIDQEDAEWFDTKQWVSYGLGVTEFRATHEGSKLLRRQLADKYGLAGYDATKYQKIIHINGNKLDFRKCNLAVKPYGRTPLDI